MKHKLKTTVARILVLVGFLAACGSSEEPSPGWIVESSEGGNTLLTSAEGEVIHAQTATLEEAPFSEEAGENAEPESDLGRVQQAIIKINDELRTRQVCDFCVCSEGVCHCYGCRPAP